MALQWTADQQAVIQADPGNLLVSAAAGSGKTAVLTERIVDRIRQGQLDIQHVLVVTFTEAAARSMRDKIEAKLHQARSGSTDPTERRRLSRQLALLPTAAISTIHAFCLQVIRNFYHLSLDSQGRFLVEPGFSVQDPFESQLLLRQVLDDWFNSQYEAIDRTGDPANQPDDPQWERFVDAFYRLTDGYGDSRSDQPVRELLLRLYQFLRSLPDYPDFVRQKLHDLSDAAGDFSGSLYGRTLFDQLRLRLDRAQIVLAELQAQLSGSVRFMADSQKNQKMNAHLASVLSILEGLQQDLQQGRPDWDAIRARAGLLESLKMPRATRRDPAEKTAFLDLFAQYVAEAVFFLSGSCGTPKYRRHFLFQTQHLFDKSAAEIEGEIREMLPAIELLIELVIGLDERYAEAKRQHAVLDFSDFEHMALAILRQDEAQRYYGDRFQEVYVDEYQDTSSIQEAILQAVSRDNCLMVGDIKQSIYRFRHARPQIFRHKSDGYSSGSGGRLLELNRNFRSVSGILGSVNDLFVQLMSEGAGEIEYDRHQALVPHRPDDLLQSRPVEVLLLNLNESAPDEPVLDDGPAAEDAEDNPQAGTGFEDENSLAGEDHLVKPEDMDRYEREALLVIRQLRLLHTAGRPWRDMVILARTRSIMAAYREQLEAGDIPVSADIGSSVMDAPVIRLLEAMIHVLDNWRQDIPLAAVMHGGIGHEVFSIEDMALIRLFRRSSGFGFFHEAVLAYRQDGPDEALRGRLDRFLSGLAGLREKEQVLSIGELIGLMVAQTGWIDRIAAEPDGGRQVRLLRRFQSWAEDYEKNRPKGLFRFARYLENLRAQDGPDAPIEPEVDEDDRVRIMTIHGSKGLEFPVVFLVGTSGRMTGSDSQEHIIFSESLGIGFDYADPDRRVRYPTHLKIAMLDEIRSAGLAEELRLLYVAMTRAMDRLYLAGTVAIDPARGDRRLVERIEQARQNRSRRLPDHLVRSARTFLEWIVMALARNPSVDLTFLEGSGDGSTDLAGFEMNDPVLDATDSRAAEEDNDCRPADQTWPDGTPMPGLERSSPTWAITCLPLEAVRLEEDRQRQQIRERGLAGQKDGAASACGSSATGPQAAAASLAAPSPASPDRLYRLIIEPYRFEQAARTPVKLTVSELKRPEPADDPDRTQPGFWAGSPAQSWRGIDLALNRPEHEDHLPPETTSRLNAARLGTALHSVFRYLDLPAARRQPTPQEIVRQIDVMGQTGMLPADDVDEVLAFVPVLVRFACSDLAGDLVLAMESDTASVYQEMPFTLAMPACRVYDGCAGLAPDDQVMIQGIIDCWYRDEAGITLIDYKSDRIGGGQAVLSETLIQRYDRQMAWYAQAIRTLTGQPVSRCLIWHIRSGQAIACPLPQ